MLRDFFHGHSLVEKKNKLDDFVPGEAKQGAASPGALLSFFFPLQQKRNL